MTSKRPRSGDTLLSSSPAGTTTKLNRPIAKRLRTEVRKLLREFEQDMRREKYRSPRSKAWSRDKILAALKAESRHSRNTAPRDEVYSHESVAPIAVDKKGAKK